MFDEPHPELELELLGRRSVGNATRLFTTGSNPFVRLDHHLELRSEAGLADLPQFDLDREETQLVGSAFVEELQGRRMLGAESFGHPDHPLRTHSGRIGEDLTEVRVVGFFELILDDNLAVGGGVRSNDVGRIGTNGSLNSV